MMITTICQTELLVLYNTAYILCQVLMAPFSRWISLSEIQKVKKIWFHMITQFIFLLRKHNQHFSLVLFSLNITYEESSSGRQPVDFGSCTKNKFPLSGLKNSTSLVPSEPTTSSPSLIISIGIIAWPMRVQRVMTREPRSERKSNF